MNNCQHHLGVKAIYSAVTSLPYVSFLHVCMHTYSSTSMHVVCVCVRERRVSERDEKKRTKNIGVRGVGMGLFVY